MKLGIAWLAILCLALAAIPAWAQNQIYDNGPINGTTDAWTINFGYVVSDTFNTSYGYEQVGFSFGVWEFPGDVMSSVDWSITSGENGGTVYGSGTASGNLLTDRFLSTNQYGYNIDLITVQNLNLDVGSGKYWLNLFNATVSSGDPVYWDENSGAGCRSNGCPSSASESALGTIPSEAFTVTAGYGYGSPEPSIVLLLGSGALGIAGVLRWKAEVLAGYRSGVSRMARPTFLWLGGAL